MSGFTVPNYQDAAFPDQAKLFSVDLEALSAGYRQTGVRAGITGLCEVTAKPVPNMTVAVADGDIYIAGVSSSIASTSLVIATAHASNPRFDIVVAAAGGASVVTGTPAIAAVPPPIPADSTLLATVYVPPSDLAVNSNQIIDKRVFISIPDIPAAYSLVVKQADETISTAYTTPAAMNSDNELRFNAQAGSLYHFDTMLWAVSTASQTFNVGWSLPAGASIAWTNLPGVYGQSYLQPLSTTSPLGLAFVSIAPTTVIFNATGWISVGATGGVANLTWNPSGSAALTVRGGSFIRYVEEM